MLRLSECLPSDGGIEKRNPKWKTVSRKFLLLFLELQGPSYIEPRLGSA